jgi:hypothetical protein
MALSNCSAPQRWIKRNAIFIGGTGTGKTHLCIAVASAVIRSRARGRFFNLVDLVNQLEQEKAAGRSGQLSEKLQHQLAIQKPQLIVPTRQSTVPPARSAARAGPSVACLALHLQGGALLDAKQRSPLEAI